MSKELRIMYRWFLKGWQIKAFDDGLVWYKNGYIAYDIQDFLKPYINWSLK
jgi:hypothetical protein